MSREQFNQLIKKITTESSDPAKSSDLASAFSGLTSLEGQAKVDALAEKFAELGKTQGFDVSVADVKEYFNSLKEQYDTNPVVASMMDSYCSTTCHIGSAVGGG